MRKHRFADLEIETPGVIEIRHHEGAIICSLEQHVSEGQEDLKGIVCDCVSGIARWTEEQGGLVGHIKAFLQTASGSQMYSCTGGELHVQDLPETGDLLLFTAIVFFVDELQLKKQVEAHLEKIR